MNLTKELSARRRCRKRPSSVRFVEGYAVADVESAKQIRLCGLRLANRDMVQPNWGRVQDVESREYANSFQQGDIDLEAVDNWSYSYVSEFSLPRHGSHRLPPESVDLDAELQGIISAFGNASLSSVVVRIAQSADGRKRLRLFQSWLSDAAGEATDSPSNVTVLEQLEGFVEQIDGSTAFVSLTSEHGEELRGEYPAEQLLAKGIEERRRFRVRTIESDGSVHVSIDPIDEFPISLDEEKAIHQRLDELLADDELDGDY